MMIKEMCIRLELLSICWFGSMLKTIPGVISVDRLEALFLLNWHEDTLTLVGFSHVFFILFRFEMPYNIWCGGCNSMIAKGVRFNAEKKQVGNYYSTKV